MFLIVYPIINKYLLVKLKEICQILKFVRIIPYAQTFYRNLSLNLLNKKNERSDTGPTA